MTAVSCRLSEINGNNIKQQITVNLKNGPSKYLDQTSASYSSVSHYLKITRYVFGLSSGSNTRSNSGQ